MKESSHIYIDQQGKIYPEWYWKKGLHDAHVLRISEHIFGYDPILRASNCVDIKLDASQAMFDTSITAISFFNCKVLTPELDIEGMWWIRDRLYADAGKYVLEIDLQSPKNQHRFILRFDYCKIER